ncbi:hypothetical protein ARMGADRAFT_1084733 [Armillaria gallica]|uniref:Uncharacterized protein n=1 Tax=Armillaria gallica TaxID=47427 RepID=A0A2H3DLR9_ARMGA|nr:hypothetical protein ARMGADRAFT_1084733 [Armillaria gallica]
MLETGMRSTRRGLKRLSLASSVVLASNCLFDLAEVSLCDADSLFSGTRRWMRRGNTSLGGCMRSYMNIRSLFGSQRYWGAATPLSTKNRDVAAVPRMPLGEFTLTTTNQKARRMAQMFSAEFTRHLSREDGVYLYMAAYNDLYRNNHQRLPIPMSCTTLIHFMATNSYGTLRARQPVSPQDEGSIVGNGKGFCRHGSSSEELNELQDFSFTAGLSDERNQRQQRIVLRRNCDLSTRIRDVPVSLWTLVEGLLLNDTGFIINQKASSFVVIVLCSIYYAPSLHILSPPMCSGTTSVSQLVTIQDIL